jgi:hypothetical protein
MIIGVLALLVYGGMLALVDFVKVSPREITQTVVLPQSAK